MCDLLEMRDRSPFTLSYGEKRSGHSGLPDGLRPKVLLLDEPFSGLEFEFRHRILDALIDYGERNDSAIIVTSHDPLIDSCWADRSFTIEEGRLRGTLTI